MELPPVKPCRVGVCLAIGESDRTTFDTFNRLISGAVEAECMSEEAALEMIQGTNTIRCGGGFCVRLMVVSTELRGVGYFDELTRRQKEKLREQEELEAHRKQQQEAAATAKQAAIAPSAPEPPPKAETVTQEMPKIAICDGCTQASVLEQVNTENEHDMGLLAAATAEAEKTQTKIDQGEGDMVDFDQLQRQNLDAISEAAGGWVVREAEVIERVNTLTCQPGVFCARDMGYRHGGGGVPI